MGRMCHHAIVVTSWSDTIAAARAAAVAIFGDAHVSPILESGINGYSSFFIPPDGSKEGWVSSNEGDDRRDRFVAYMNSTRYAAGSGPLSWIEVQYGDDDGDTRVVRHGDYNDEPDATMLLPAPTRHLLQRPDHRNDGKYQFVTGYTGGGAEACVHLSPDEVAARCREHRGPGTLIDDGTDLWWDQSPVEPTAGRNPDAV